MRINKLFSNYGICSRKETNRLIREERVLVNGKLAIEGQWVEEDDEILIDNELIKKKEKIYIILNKPIGVTCTLSNKVENNIIDFMNYKEYIFPVGRLDKDSQGLIIMTNDGDFANSVINQENKHEKEYIVTVDKAFDEEFINSMSIGVNIGGVVTRECKVTRISDYTFKIILTQGLNRQIRRMTKHFGYNVTKLERIRILNLKIDELQIGKWRYITKNEFSEILKLLNEG